MSRVRVRLDLPVGDRAGRVRRRRRHCHVNGKGGAGLAVQPLPCYVAFETASNGFRFREDEMLAAQLIIV